MATFESPGSSDLLIRPVAGKIGAAVSGLRLAGDLNPVTVDAIRKALYRFKVLFFRGQEHLDEDGQEAFGRLFGDLVPHPTIPSVKGTQNVLDVDGTTGARASAWHTDVTFVDAYPQISILRALVVPEYGGDTVWANTAAAYQSLTPQLRDLADNLWALHSNRSDYAQKAKTKGTKTQLPLQSRHPYKLVGIDDTDLPSTVITTNPAKIMLILE